MLQFLFPIGKGPPRPFPPHCGVYGGCMPPTCPESSLRLVLQPKCLESEPKSRRSADGQSPHAGFKSNRWHRSVIKYGGSGSVRSSHQTVSDYTLRQRFPNTQQSRFLAQRLEKLVLPSIFDIFWWCETCRVIQQQFKWKNVTFLWGQNILWPLLHIFRSQDPQLPRIQAYAPEWSQVPCPK